MNSVWLGPNNIDQFISTLPDFVEEAGDFGQLSSIAMPTFNGINTRGYLDPQDPASPFYGVDDLSYFIFRIKTAQGTTIYAGELQSITVDNGNKTAVATTKNVLQTALDMGVVYSTATELLTPADIAREICASYGIAIDAASFGISAGLYATDNVFLRVIMIAPVQSVGEVLQELADIGCARIYAVNSVMYFEAYELRDDNPIVTISDSPSNVGGLTLWQAPMVEPVQKQLCDGYYVVWAGNPAISFGPENGNRKSIEYGEDKPIQILSAQAATWIGERWFDYLNRAQNRIKIGLPETIGKDLLVGYAISVDYSTWDMAVTIDLTSIDRSNPLMTVVTGITR